MSRRPSLPEFAMSHRTFLLALALLTGLPGTASAGWWEDGNPGGTIRLSKLQDLQVSGKLTGYKLKGTHGRTVEVRLPRAQGLEQAIALPAGAWDEITLIVDGPLTVRSAQGKVQLEVDSLTVVLDDPEARQIHLEWSLPEGALGQGADALRRALEDGGVAAP